MSFFFKILVEIKHRTLAMSKMYFFINIITTYCYLNSPVLILIVTEQLFINVLEILCLYASFKYTKGNAFV